MAPTHHAVQMRIGPDAPATARDFVRRWCRSRRREDTDLVLVASELVSLVARTDSDARLGVRIERHNDGVLLSVTTPGLAFQPDDHTCEVLDQITQSWDVDDSPSGVRAWALIQAAAQAEEH